MNGPADTVLARCAAVLAAHGHAIDAAQERAAARLDDLLRRLTAAAPGRRRRGLVARLFGGPGPQAPQRGVYLWGGVGRGKTLLMDAFFDVLPPPGKRRSHFHRFMRDVHARLGALRAVDNPLERIADEIATETRVLCFDEFAVADVADALLLGGLLEGLFRRGVTLVATSNVPPAALYHGGLQRQRFLPAIALLEQHAEVVEVAGSTDYRLRQLERSRLYLGPGEADPEAVLLEEFDAIAGGPGRAAVALEVNGRTIRARRATATVAWFDFSVLCQGPRSADDYIELARLYHTVVLSGVPVLDGTQDNAARRFIALIDEFYDRGVKLIVSAAAEPAALYAGERLAFEFRRAASRLVEMRGHDYLARPHRP